VTRAALKSGAESAVQAIKGVATVDNQIELLPVSPQDERLRKAVFRAIYEYGPLERYNVPAGWAIRIVVKDGKVALEGAVASEGDKQLAGFRARGVRLGVLVANNLRVAK
jgi:hyperosmotically inducible periplasmic protein